jgi:hypothetical protein
MPRNLRSVAILFGVLTLILVIFLVVGNLAREDQVPVTGDPDADVMGEIFVSADVHDSGCPVEASTRFLTNQPIYAGFEQNRVPAGSTIQARLTHNGSTIAESEQVTAAEGDQGGCIYFTFQPEQAGGFPPGDYIAEMYVDGQLADQIQFTVDAAAPDEFEPDIEN